MKDIAELLVRAAVIGVGGAALMDLWGLLVRRAFGIRGLDYAHLGRWIGHIPQGQLLHERIASAEPVRGERLIGWVAHYSIGVAFATLLLVAWGVDWAQSPTIGPAMIVGVGTIAAPWLIMQPAMGVGVAASHSPNPAAARVRNLATHVVYGVGLYLSAVVLSIAWP